MRLLFYYPYRAYLMVMLYFAERAIDKEWTAKASAKIDGLVKRIEALNDVK